MAQELVNPPPAPTRLRPTATVRVSGDVDLLTAADLRDQLHAVIREQPVGLVVVDLAEVTFMDCWGLRPLLDARARIGRRLRVRHAPAQVLHLLECTGTADVLLPRTRSVNRRAARGA